ncbi:F0F1 ATP synthase subunit delta [Candidatus Kaiserbacteria bacterium]|nr:F0F1 ATP synthase subunit delta [Candidatus Kaiserbacteria bacterium]
MEHAYAQALWEMVEGGAKPKEAVSKLLATLKLHGREALMPRIARAFARIAARESAKKSVTLTIADEKHAAAAKRTAKEALHELGIDTEDLAIQADDSLIGGWRLEGRERLHDASYKKSLLSIYNRATQ